MPEHDYSPEQAFDILMQRIENGNAEIAQHIQNVIDQGRDIVETEPLRGRRRNPRTYRRTVALTPEEAFKVAVESLRAISVEQSLFVGSAAANFQHAARRTETPSESFTDQYDGLEEPKEIQIELQTETQISPAISPTRTLQVVPVDDISVQQTYLDRLLELADFT